MLGLKNLEVYISIFNRTDQTIKFELYTEPSDSIFSFTDLKDKVAEVLDLPHSSTEVLEHEK